MKAKKKLKKESYLPEFIYGSMDGLVTTFAIVTGSIGAALPAGIILIIGFANVLADAFSMGSSSYLSAVSEESMHEHAHVKRPIRKSIITFVSFALVGLIPLMPFVGAYWKPSLAPYAIQVSIIATMIAFAGVGYISGSKLGKNPIRTAIRNVLIGGTAAAIAFGVGHVLANVFGV
ncbi:MAG: VIT1/CCC1 transporter family protein [Candidatus Pacebacteria bacterium]|nr:VIT1/CCC1 transporter family protein [Candidatus Paceibacterota bacterium]